MKKIYFLVSSQEKNKTVLIKRLEYLCNIFSINTSLEYLYTVVNNVLTEIYKLHGPKRGSTRDSIICLIFSSLFPSINNDLILFHMKFSPKYLHTARDLLLDTSFDLKNKNYTQFVNIDSITCIYVDKLIEKCIKNDIFIHKSYKSLESACLYKILVDNNYLVDSYELSTQLQVSHKLLLENFHILNGLD